MNSVTYDHDVFPTSFPFLFVQQLVSPFPVFTFGFSFLLLQDDVSELLKGSGEAKRVRSPLFFSVLTLILSFCYWPSPSSSIPHQSSRDSHSDSLSLSSAPSAHTLPPTSLTPLLSFCFTSVPSPHASPPALGDAEEGGVPPGPQGSILDPVREEGGSYGEMTMEVPNSQLKYNKIFRQQ